MPTRRPRSSGAAMPTPLDSFSSFRRWATLAAFSLVVTLGGYVIQQDRGRLASLEARVSANKETGEKDLRELRERVTAEYQGQLQATSQVSERLGRVETQLADISKHIDSIDSKLK